MVFRRVFYSVVVEFLQTENMGDPYYEPTIVVHDIVSLGRLFHNRIEVGKKLYLYASIAVSGCINLRSLPLVFLVL